MHFVIDETSWKFDGIAADLVIESLENLLDVIDDVQADKYACFYSEDLFYEPVLSGMSFYELYQQGAPLEISRFIQERVAVAFARLRVWQDTDKTDWPQHLDVTIGSAAPECAPSIAWAHSQTARSESSRVACIVHSCGRADGVYDVLVGGQTETLGFVDTRQSYERYFRWIACNLTRSPADLESIAAQAFRNLAFVPGCFNGIKQMSGGYTSLIPDIVRHLSALSDVGAQIFQGDRTRVAAEFGPYGVDISDENGNTKGNSKAKSERTRVLNEVERIFWWHTKLERHQNRIHLCPDDVASGGRVLVGIFCEHLTV